MCHGEAAFKGVEHTFKGVELAIRLNNGADLPIGIGDEGCGSGARVDLPEIRVEELVGNDRRVLAGVDREGVEGRIELSVELVESLVAEVECAVGVGGERNIDIGAQSGGATVLGDRSGIAGRRMDEVEVVTEIGEVEPVLNFSQRKGVGAEGLNLPKTGNLRS